MHGRFTPETDAVLTGAARSDGARLVRGAEAPLDLILVLSLPYFCFAIGFLNFVAGCVSASLLFIAVAFYSWRSVRHGPAAIDVPIFMTCAVLSIVLLLLGGEGRLFYATYDWIIRDAVLEDLVRQPWPVGYKVGDEHFILRAPLGMYLFPAMLGKWTNIPVAVAALVAQNAVLLTLILYRLVSTCVKASEKLLTLAVFLIFSGLDIVPTLLDWGVRTWLGQAATIPSHIEWWAGWFQYSAHITQLFWVPHHALAGWAFVAAFASWRAGGTPAPALVAVFTLCLFWSPLAMMGACPLIGFALLVDLVEGKIKVRDCVAPALTLIGALPAIAFMVQGSAEVTKGFLLFEPGFIAIYTAFICVEVLPYFAIVLKGLETQKRKIKWERAIVAASLLMIPMYLIGVSNDFAMRASIPALALLALYTAASLNARWQSGQRNWVWICVILAIGAVTPSFEIARSLREPATPMSSCNLIDAWRHSPTAWAPMSTYLARQQDLSAPMTWLLRTQDAQPVIAAANAC